MVNKSIDRSFGLENEQMEINNLSTFFNTKLMKLSKYNSFDFVNPDKTIYFELKTRRCKLKKYATTMITYSKILKGLEYVNKDKLVYFIFKYTDGMYYYQLTDSSLADCTISSGGRADRGAIETNQYCYIPIHMLIPIYIQSIPTDG